MNNHVKSFRNETIELKQYIPLFGESIVDEWRLTGTINVSNLPPLPIINLQCNCNNNYTNKTCCRRMVARAHKMGYEWSRKIGVELRPRLERNNFTNIFVRQEAIDISTAEWPKTDVKAMLILRNIYSSLLSGFVYHRSGMECWRNEFGQELVHPLPLRYHQDWRNWITSLPQLTLQSYDSLCHLLAHEPTEIGLRVYVEWVMRRHYGKHGTFVHLALATLVPWIKDRTMIQCFETVTTVPMRESMQEWLDYFYHNSGMTLSHFNLAENDQAPQGSRGESGAGGHSTNVDAQTRRKLFAMIRRLDAEHFGGQIAWIDSKIPCGK
ncbi:hypothetical protein MPSEU_000766600 [Mayamaea pseudoterrestris]|nr:hypothetical protein MPSEU_000766600 [Mayamaea pseudoterrestris]